MTEHGRGRVSEAIESYAADVYLNDSTGENFIENIIHATNLPTLMNRLSSDAFNQPVLEMGFGEGTITEPLVRAGLTVEIVEGSEKLCENARQRFGEKVKVHCSYFENFNPPRKYKTVLSLHVLEHVDHPDEIASKMYEWVQPGGQVIAVVPNAESLHRQLAVMMGLQERNDSLSPRDKVVGHQRVLDLPHLTRHFENAGFRVTEVFGYFLKTVPNSMMTTWSPDLIKSLTTISNALPPNLMANIGLVATRQ